MLFFACMFMTASIAFAQKQVTGTVTDSDTGEPIIGAAVKLPGTTTGTLTDIDGKFTLKNIPSSAKTIAVSFMGMKSVEVPIKANMTIALESDTKDLGEVMVVAFGTAKKSSYTGSAKVVNSETLEKAQVSNVIDALAGAVPGLQVTSSNGAPGSQSTIRIRGFSSLNADNAPLFVVDGAPCNDNFDIGNLNPNDIESVNVLKDAASNALYGARGANGVVMITTKKAKQGDAQISFDAKWGWNSRALQYYNTIDSPAQYYEMQYGALNNYYKSTGMSDADAWAKANANLTGDQGNGGLGYNIWTVPEGQVLIGNNGKMNPCAKLGYTTPDGYYIIPDNWDKEATRNGLRQEYNVSATAASEKSNFYAGLGYLSTEGITENSDYQRFSARLKADYKLKPWVKLGMNSSYARVNRNELGNNGAETSTGNIWAMTMGMAPIYPFYVRNADGSYKYDSNNIQVLDYGNGKNGGMYRPFLSDANPLQDNRLNTDNTEGNVFMGNVFADFYITKGLTLTVNGTVDLDENRYTEVLNPYYGQFDSAGGTVTKQHYRYFSYNLQQLLNYTFTIKDHNNFNVLAGHEYTYDKYYNLYATKTKMFDQANKELAGAISDSQGAYSALTRYNNEGYFLRAMYDYDERIFASASYRRDASSRFHPDNRWGNFWSAGAAWRIGKESWFPETNWLDELKLKASIGSQGNDKIGSYRYTDLYEIQPSDGNVGTAFSRKGNKDITWETNTNINVGLEFEVFKKLSGSLEYFNRRTTDMLMAFPVAASLGYSSFYKNVGDMSNSGVELDLNANIFNKKNFQWDVNVNFSYLRNRITKLHDDVKTGTSYDANGKEYKGYVSGDYFIAEGTSIYTWRTKEYAGVNENGESLWWKNTYDDNDKWTGRETTNVYSEADYYVTKKSNVPPVFGGLGTGLRFYGFDFAIQTSFQIGGYAWDGSYQSMMASPTATNTGFNFHADQLKAWTADNTGSDIPRFQFADQYASANSDRWLTKASYLNIENINFGYTLPTTLTNKVGINNLRLYMAAENVFYWSLRRGFDPRQSFDDNRSYVADRTNATNYSPMRSVSFGLKLTF